MIAPLSHVSSLWRSDIDHETKFTFAIALIGNDLATWFFSIRLLTKNLNYIRANSRKAWTNDNTTLCKLTGT